MCTHLVARVLPCYTHLHTWPSAESPHLPRHSSPCNHLQQVHKLLSVLLSRPPVTTPPPRLQRAGWCMPLPPPQPWHPVCLPSPQESHWHHCFVGLGATGCQCWEGTPQYPDGQTLSQGMGSTQATVVELVPGQSGGAWPPAGQLCHGGPLPAAEPQEQRKVRAEPPGALCNLGDVWGPAGSQASGQAGGGSPSNTCCTLLPPHY